MDKFTETLSGGLRRCALAGVGAVAVTVDKSREVFDHLARKGESAAASSQAACGELQRRLAGQLDAFSARLKADCENAAFEQLVEKCRLLSPEQKSLLIERITAESGPEEETYEAVSEENPAEPCCEASACQTEQTADASSGGESAADEAPAEDAAEDE